MSFVTDQIRRIDAQLDRLQLASTISVPSSPVLRAQSQDPETASNEHVNLTLEKVTRLQNTIKALSTASSSQPLLQTFRIQRLLENAELSDAESLPGPEAQDPYEKELEWLLVSKATVQTHGLILDAFLNQIIPLNDDVWYWDEVLGSYAYSGFYMLQTSPLRFWGWGRDIYREAADRLDALRGNEEEAIQGHKSISQRWRTFYGLVKQTIRDRSIEDIQSKAVSPVTKCRMEARAKQKNLRKLREMTASGLGVLMDEGLTFDADDLDSVTEKNGSDEHRAVEWKSIVSKSVALIDTVLRNVTTLETGVSEFEDIVFSSVEDESEGMNTEEGLAMRPAALAQKLQQILTVLLPTHAAASRRLAQEHGRPSRVIRYWIPAVAILFSSSTLLRVFFNRKAEIIQWIQDLGATTRDFWYNWVVEPVKKVVGTIRHDKDSEIAIMSKESLEGDRASLERMVVDFAVDNPSNKSGSLSETEIADVRAKVREGDLTPVLRAYEKDLRKPFVGTIRGDLIRALLIQIQKTKVDVEVAVGGIDALLKSQELVFGFVGLTPGVLVCFGMFRWLGSTLGGRSGKSKGKRQTRMVRVLRNIDRILTAYKPSSNGMLSYKEHGLLLCEVHVLRQNGQRVMPSEVNREFLEEISDLVDIRTGVERQLKVVERIRWAYWRWLQAP